MHGMFTNAVQFSTQGDRERIASLGAQAIATLSALWAEAPRRGPWVSGQLQVYCRKPEHAALRPEEIAKGTGYKLGRYVGEQRIAVVGERYELPEEEKILSSFGKRTPDIVALCAGKRPAFVEFDLAGYGAGRQFAHALAVAAELVRSGYYGALRCYSAAINDYEFSNPERCVISVNEDGLLGLKICWGDEKLVGPLFDLCRAEKFTEEDIREAEGIAA